MSAKARAHRLEKLGVERLYELNFNAALSGLTPPVNLRAMSLSMALVCAMSSSGPISALARPRRVRRDLQDFGAEMGFGVSVAELLSGAQGQVSSTAIRNALTEGRPRDAAAMLGHWHRIESSVIGGDQRGRVLGFPTANMSIDGLHPPKFGVYAVLADVLEGPPQGQLSRRRSMGVRPMFGENKPNLETYLFDFSGDLYGTAMSVGLVATCARKRNSIAWMT